jgi:hypothetical protein
MRVQNLLDAGKVNLGVFGKGMISLQQQGCRC